MILTGSQILADWQAGNIIITPFDESQINPNSYNYRLGEVLFGATDDVMDPKAESNMEKIVIPANGYYLQPGRLYLGSTYEKIGSDKYSIQLIGRSSVGRLGLFLQVSASLGHVGTNHNWTLELKVVQPLKVYPRMKIGQITFWKVEGKNDTSYTSRYWQYSDAHISEFFKEYQEGEIL